MFSSGVNQQNFLPSTGFHPRSSADSSQLAVRYAERIAVAEPIRSDPALFRKWPRCCRAQRRLIRPQRRGRLIVMFGCWNNSFSVDFQLLVMCQETRFLGNAGKQSELIRANFKFVYLLFQSLFDPHLFQTLLNSF